MEKIISYSLSIFIVSFIFLFAITNKNATIFWSIFGLMVASTLVTRFFDGREGKNKFLFFNKHLTNIFCAAFIIVSLIIYFISD